MKILLSTILFLTTLQSVAQFDYELFMSFQDRKSLEQNSKINSVTEFQLDKEGRQIKTSTRQFNKKGLPVLMAQFDPQGQLTMQKEFRYGVSDNLTSIETYKGKEHQSSTEFETNQLGQISTYTDYVYSSYNGEKIFAWHTIIEYSSNKKLKRMIKLQGVKRDTVQVDFFNPNGIKTKTLMNMGGLRTVKIEYSYNKDSTEMLEKHYENATRIYNTITHRYKNKKEVEKIDLTTSDRPFYWRYDDKGNVIETNDGFYYTLYFKYDPQGYLTDKIVEIIHSDSNETDLPKKIQFKYEYEFKH